MAKELGVGVVGPGWVAGAHIKAFQSNPHSKVVAICARTMDRARQRAQEMGLDKSVKLYDDYDKMLADPNVDIVDICTPNDRHAMEVMKAAGAGKHMVIEKPVCVTLDELKGMHDAVRKAGVKTIVCFELRFGPIFTTLKRLMADDAIGDVFYVEAAYIHNLADWYAGWDWAHTRDRGGSAFLVGGCHAVDAIRWFASTDEHAAVNIVEVKAYEGGWRKDLEYPGLQTMIVKFANDAIGQVSANFDTPCPYVFPFHVYGTKGHFRDNKLFAKHKFPGQTGWVDIPSILPDSGDVSHHPFQPQMDHFVECILKDQESFLNLEDAVNTHEACFAAEIAARENRTVKLPLLP